MKNINLTVLSFVFGLSCFAQWGQVNSGISNLTFGAKLLGNSNTHLFSGTLGDSKMYRTNDKGMNWTEIQPPVSNVVPECGYNFNGNYFSGLNSAQDCIFYTSDNGETWKSVVGAPQTTVVRSFNSASGNLYALTSSKGIYKSSDNGVTWSSANSGLTNLNVISMEIINSKLIAGTIGGGVFISSDSGETWVESNSGIGGGDLNAELIWKMGDILYYTAQGGGAYTSSNDGLTWASWTKPSFMGLGVLEIHRNGSNLYLESRHFSGGLRDSIFLTSNEGLTWTNITENLSALNLNASGITEFDGVVFITYNLLSPDLGIYSKTTTASISKNDSEDLIRLYPNPFNTVLTISNLSNKDIDEITLYDIEGKITNVEKNNSNSINTSSLNKGVYFVKILFVDKSSVVTKLVK